eukprot:s3413_g1.t1
MQGISAGQLATVLTAYTPLTDTAANTASIGTNSAAVAALQAQVAAIPAPPDLTPYALAADLAAAEGSIAANASSITSLSSSLTTGLAGKANQSALDALQLDVNGKSTPASVDLKLANHPTSAAMNSAITSANNTTLATVAANYGLKSTQDQLALDVAARQTAADVDQKIATALLDRPTTTDLNSTVALRTTPTDVSQLIATALLPFVQHAALDAALAIRDGRLDAAEAALAVLQAAGFQSAADVAAALATALAGYTDTAGLNALLAVRDARLDGHDAEILALQGAGPFATAADLSASETSLQSAIDALNAALAALTTGGGTNRQTTWDLLVGTNTIRNWHFSAPLSGEVNALLAPLASESWVLATLGSYYTSSETNGAIAAALTAYYDSAQTDAAIVAALVPYSTTAQMDTAIAAAVGAIDLSGYSTIAARDAALAVALVPYSTTMQMDAAIAAAVGAIDLSGYSTITARDAAIAAALISGAGLLTEAQGDARYHPVNGNAGGGGIIPMVLDNFTPRMIRALLPQAPLRANLILGNSATVLLQHRLRASRLPVYHVVNGNAGGGGIIPMVLDNFTPRMIRALLPQAPLGANLVLGNSATVQLTCDCYSKSESDSRYATPADLDVISCTSLTATSFVNTLNFAATGNVTGVDALFTADVQTPLLRAVSGDGYLRVAAGLVGTQFLDSGAAVIAEMTSSQIALEQD